jgi:hypothetical protein
MKRAKGMTPERRAEIAKKASRSVSRAAKSQTSMTLRPTIYAFATIAALAAPALAIDLPLNPVVTQETIGSTICVPGWTKTVRPSARYTSSVKLRLVHELEITEELLVDFELDHRIPLALGGAVSDPHNLEFQPWDEAGEKDQIEAFLSRAVCASKIALDEARRRI